MVARGLFILRRILFCFVPLLVFVGSIQCKDNKAQKEANQVIRTDLNKKSKWSKAVFAGGCFWCMEPPFDKLDGVKATISGYAGGVTKNPSYDKVASGLTDHLESILVLYDKKKVNFSQLVEVFWQNIDPTQTNGQFYDIGAHYKTAIFHINPEQKKIAEKSKAVIEKSKLFSKPIATKILSVHEFWQAEEYHQDYYKKKPIHYYSYRKGSGRDAFIKKYWSKK